MPAFAFALPVVPGKETLDRETLEEMQGTRRAEYEDQMRAAGITRHTVWHQQTPDGTIAVVYMEAEDEAAIGAFGASAAPLNTWFRERMKEVHGLDITQPGPPVEKVHDIQL